jgi:SNF2 family DNA or RNA helicase
VFSNFKEPVYQLAELLKQYQPLVNTGDQDDTLVGRNVDLFQYDPDYKVFLGTHGKCGTGWTLNAASYLICIDTPWTDASLSQSTDRIWRVTNTRPAIVTVLTCIDTIDERVREIVETKKELSDYLVDGKSNELSISMQNELRRILQTL